MINMTSGQTLMLLHRLLQRGHKLGFGVYTNSEVIKDVLEKEYGFPCTLIQLKPDREHRIVNTRLLILDQIEQLKDHKPKPEIKGKKQFDNIPKYWNLYDTKEIQKSRREKF